MYANLWTILISISGSRRTSSKARERVRLSLKRGGISSWTSTIIIDLERILLGNLGLQLLRWLTRCSESQCIKSWRKSRMSHTSNSQTRWGETPWGATKVFIASTTRNEDTPLKTVELCGITWSSQLEMEDYNSFCIGLVGKGTKQGQRLRGTLLQGPLWVQLMLFIFAAPERTGSQPSRMMFVARPSIEDSNP